MRKMHKDLLTHYKECVTENKWLTPSDARVMLSHIDAIEVEKDRLLENVSQLNKELQQEREDKKVEVPKEVAEGIKFYKEHGREFVLYNIGRVKDLSELEGNDHLGSIWNYVSASPENTITYLKALVNGYTIEEPPSVESRIQSTIYAELKRQGITSPAPIDYVAKCLTDLISPIVVKDALQHEQS